LTVKNQFEGSEANLRRFLDRKISKFVRIATTGNEEDPFNTSNTGSESEPEHAVHNLLQLSKEILFEDSSRNLPKLCQRALKSVQRCLYVDPSGDDFATFEQQRFSQEVATKMVLVLLLLMLKLQQKGQGKLAEKLFYFSKFRKPCKIKINFHLKDGVVCLSTGNVE
jgi:hypothetical protein